MVDNSQGHSSYAEDALLVSRMNMKPAGKQARMWDEWYVRDKNRITQPMVFPADHPDFPNMPKGMKQVLHEHGIDTQGLQMLCKEKCHNEATSCCATCTLELQPDFQAQKSLVQEVIEAAGHLCIFLPKFHCKLNVIEFFWGAVKRYLRTNCDYTLVTLKKNFPGPLALASVNIRTIR